MELTWYIPKEIWQGLNIEQKEALEQVNRNCPYPTTPGLHKTWIITPTFGELYACRMDSADIERITRICGDIPAKYAAWKAKFSTLQLS